MTELFSTSHQNSKILLTGVAGFIGSRVAQFLLSEGYTVVGLDNLDNGYDIGLKRWHLAQLEGQSSFECYLIDILDEQALRDLFKNSKDSPFDAVINLAARSGVRQSVANPWVCFETNATGTLNLLQLCREFGVKKFVLASTSSLYSANNILPLREDANTDRPLSPYAASKKAAEEMCHTFHYLYDIDITVIRYFTVYGPAGRPDMSLFRCIQGISEGRPVTISGDGKQLCDFTYIDDIAWGTIASLKPLGYEIINLGSDEPIKMDKAIQLVEEMVGKKANIILEPPHRADALTPSADIGKAQRLLGWRPQTTFAEGIARFVAWYKKNYIWARRIATN
jgi:nucleoside-diphosphate-sugar epimerase